MIVTVVAHARDECTEKKNHDTRDRKTTDKTASTVTKVLTATLAKRFAATGDIHVVRRYRMDKAALIRSVLLTVLLIV